MSTHPRIGDLVRTNFVDVEPMGKAMWCELSAILTVEEVQSRKVLR